MNFVVLNGMNSTTVRGLLIQSLPPISKPLMRAQVDEIDGRDGDIVTKLGYSAYDKEMKIGLHGDFDVDDAIRFFNSEGTVIFSNEEDKYYNYQIIKQIDFERLLRFREAIVTFHVQPYKYSIEEPIDYTGNETSISVINRGNVESKPIITIYGSGTINLSINGTQVLTISLGTERWITIDAANMEAYNTTLKNRLVAGDYDNVSLKTGLNVISWTGTVDEITIDKYSRWI